LPLLLLLVGLVLSPQRVAYTRFAAFRGFVAVDNAASVVADVLLLQFVIVAGRAKWRAVNVRRERRIDLFTNTITARKVAAASPRIAGRNRRQHASGIGRVGRRGHRRRRRHTYQDGTRHDTIRRNSTPRRCNIAKRSGATRRCDKGVVPQC
jgi:hypothetical protein